MPRGRLTDKQIRYTQLVASGMDEVLAVVEAGYSEERKYQALNKLRNNQRVLDRIALLRKGTSTDGVKVATRADREAFWTSIMNDPQHPPNARLEASKLLGKAQGDFIDRKEIKNENKIEPVVVIPNMTPEEWEKYWEDNN